jgi:hypothetical protein
MARPRSELSRARRLRQCETGGDIRTFRAVTLPTMLLGARGAGRRRCERRWLSRGSSKTAANLTSTCPCLAKHAAHVRI